MKKKKLLALVLTFTLAMSMAACGDNNAPRQQYIQRRHKR